MLSPLSITDFSISIIWEFQHPDVSESVWFWCCSVSSNYGVLFLFLPCNFFLIAKNNVLGKRSAIMRPLGVWWCRGGGGKEAFYSPTIRLLVRLYLWDCRLHKCFSGFLNSHLGGTGWLEWTGLGISFPLSQSGYDKSPGSGLTVSAEGRPG